MTMLRRIGTILAGGLLILGVGMVAPSPAQAADKCPNESGYLCFWWHANFQGGMGKVSGSNQQWWVFQGGCPGRGWDNCASSVNNEGLSCEAVIYEHESYQGASWVINRDTSVADLSQHYMRPGNNWNDKISSNLDHSRV